MTKSKTQPKKTKLFNVVRYHNPVLIHTHGRAYTDETLAYYKQQVHEWGVKWAVGKSIKRQLELKNWPKGTFFKLEPH